MCDVDSSTLLKSLYIRFDDQLIQNLKIATTIKQKVDGYLLLDTLLFILVR